MSHSRSQLSHSHQLLTPFSITKLSHYTIFVSQKKKKHFHSLASHKKAHFG